MGYETLTIEKLMAACSQIVSTPQPYNEVLCFSLKELGEALETVGVKMIEEGSEVFRETSFSGMPVKESMVVPPGFAVLTQNRKPVAIMKLTTK